MSSSSNLVTDKRMNVGGPKMCSLLVVARRPVLLLGEKHFKDTPPNVEVLENLLRTLRARVYVETETTAGSSGASASKHALRATPNFVCVDLRRGGFNNQMKRDTAESKAAASRVPAHLQVPGSPRVHFAAGTAKTTFRYRTRVCELVVAIYRGDRDDLRRLVRRCFPAKDVDAAVDAAKRFMDAFETIPGRQTIRHLSPMCDVFVERLVATKRPQGASNPVDVLTYEAARMVAWVWLVDLYTVDHILSSHGPAVFYGGADHVCNIEFLLTKAYGNGARRVLAVPQTSPSSRTLHLTDDQYTLIARVFRDARDASLPPKKRQRS